MIAAVVLAAGPGSRFGGPKQVEVLDGAALARHAVDAARAAGIEHIVVVVGSDADAVADAAGEGVTIVRNDRWREGQSTSVRAGLDALGGDVDAAIVLLADQPGIGASHVGALVDAMRARPEPVIRLRFADAPGPALLRREVWDDVRALSGDTGARELFERHPELVFDATVAGAAPADVDTRDDLERLRGRAGGENEKPPSF